MSTFEIRLCESEPQNALFFVTRCETDEDAVEYARELLEQHPDYRTAEIWNGLKLVRHV